MKVLIALPLAAALAAVAFASAIPARAEGGVSDAESKAFDKRVFAGAAGAKPSACFVRHYDAAHLKLHPKQKISAMKILVSAETPPGEPTLFTYRMGIQFKNRPGNFDGSASCTHLMTAYHGPEIRFSCGGDCGGGGIEIAMSKDDKSAVVHVSSIEIFNRRKPDGDSETLEGRGEDKVFRVDRVDTGECAELLGKGGEVASLERK